MTWNYYGDIFFLLSMRPLYIFSTIKYLTRGWLVSFCDMQGYMLRYYSRNQFFLSQIGIWPYQPRVIKILLSCFLRATKMSILATQVMHVIIYVHNYAIASLKRTQSTRKYCGTILFFFFLIKYFYIMLFSFFSVLLINIVIILNL